MSFEPYKTKGTRDIERLYATDGIIKYKQPDRSKKWFQHKPYESFKATDQNTDDA